MVKMVNFVSVLSQLKKTNYGSQYDGEDKNNTLPLTKNFFLRSSESGASSLADASSKR